MNDEPELKPKRKTRTVEIPDVPLDLVDLAVKYSFDIFSESPFRITTNHLDGLKRHHLVIDLHKVGYTKVGVAENGAFLELSKESPRNVSYTIETKIITKRLDVV